MRFANSGVLPMESVRELIANALIHQDMAMQGAGPMVEIYANRLEVSVANPLCQSRGSLMATSHVMSALRISCAA